MTCLTVKRVRAAISTESPALAISDYIRLLDAVGFREITTSDEDVLKALNVASSNSLSVRLNSLCYYGLATRRKVTEGVRGRGRIPYAYTLVR
jgi:hypothetical protein